MRTTPDLTDLDLYGSLRDVDYYGEAPTRFVVEITATRTMHAVVTARTESEAAALAAAGEFDEVHEAEPLAAGAIEDVQVLTVNP